MRRLLSGRWTPAVVVGLVMLLIAGGSFALAASGGNKRINACVKKKGGQLYQARKCKKHEKKLTWNTQGPQGKTGATGASGAPGAPGAAGAPGKDGFVQIGSWEGSVGTITANSTSFVFAGPTTTLTTTGGQSIAASGSAALAAAATTRVDVSICKQASGGAVTPLATDPATFEIVDVLTTRETFAISEAGAPGAGTWTIGMCVEDGTATAIDKNDWSIGYAFVTNSTLSVSGASKKANAHAS